MPEEMVLDAEQVVETPEVETPEVESAESSESVETQPELVEESATLSGSKLWRDLKGPLYSGKALTKPQISALKKVIQEAGSISEKYPDGIGAIETQLAAVKQLAEDETVPIEQAVEQTVAERRYFRELDDLYTKGNPEFVKKLAEASPEAFDHLAPSVIRMYAESNPQAYSSQMSKTYIQDANSADVPLHYRILATFLPQMPDFPAKQQIIDACEGLYSHFSRMKGLSEQKIEPKAIPQQQQQQNQGSDPQQAQMDLSRREWNLSVQSEGLQMVMDAAKKEITALKKQGLTDEESKKVVGLVGKELDARLLMDQGYRNAMQGYLRNNNRGAYIQRLQSERRKLIPEATRRAVQDVLNERPAKVATVQNGKQPGNGKQAQSTLKPQQGAVQFKKISGPPRTLNLTVDLNRTSQSMLVKRQAYIKGEDRPVTWA